MSAIPRHDVVIAGAGPTGMMLAAELALAGTDVVIIERRTSPALPGSRAGGLHSRTLEVLDQRGVVERFTSQGQRHPAVVFHVPLALGDLPTRHNYVLGLWQSDFERILSGWIGELPLSVHRGVGVTGFAQDADGVEVRLCGGERIRTAFLVGCDGGHSVIRKEAGIAFPGSDPTTSWLIAEAQTAVEPPWGMRQDATGSHGIGRLADGRARIVLTERQLATGGGPTLREISEALAAVYGTDFGIHTPSWISRFTDMTRQAAAYRDRRVLLAGDAAHVHPPMGGQGLNIGVQDAVNLGWKLAQVVRGTSPAGLLDTYHTERHPVAARVLRDTMAQVALRRQDERSLALGEVLAEVLGLDEPRRRMAARLAGLSDRYDLGEGHPLLGRRVPDLDLLTAGGPQRLHTLLHDARPLLLNLGEPGGFDLTPWGGRVRAVEARYTGPWELPVIGTVPAPGAVLIRPDGHAAWVGDGGHAGLPDALSTWFGPPLCADRRPIA